MTKTKTITIAPDALAVLRRSNFNANTLDLPQQLAPKDYQAVKKAINTAGGKWVRSRNTHVFPGNARAAFGDALESGKLVDEKATFQAFFTPRDVASRAASLLLTLLGNARCPVLLEPSAGEGALVDALQDLDSSASVRCIEIQEPLAKKLAALNPTLCADFLTVQPGAGVDDAFYDGVLMNPPFTGDQDAAHVLHAWSFLRPGGVLVAIVSPRFRFAGTPKQTALSSLMAERGVYEEELPAGAFRESGTNVSTSLIALRKP